MLLTCIIFNMPRSIISRKLMMIMIWWAKELGAKNVPSYWGLQQSMKKMCELVKNKSIMKVTKNGKKYYMNPITSQVLPS
jgi:hypothetical protein